MFVCVCVCVCVCERERERERERGRDRQRDRVGWKKAALVSKRRSTQITDVITRIINCGGVGP